MNLGVEVLHNRPMGRTLQHPMYHATAPLKRTTLAIPQHQQILPEIWGECQVQQHLRHAQAANLNILECPLGR